MKLLTPEQSQNSSQGEIARGVFRVEELQKAEKEQRIRLAKAEQDFNETLARNRTVWEGEFLAHNADVKGRKDEIEKLEIKKLSMLVPFEILKEGADDRFKDAESFLQGLRDREANVENLTELLEEKLDAVGGRETDLKKAAKDIEMRKAGLESQISSAKVQFEELTKAIEDFAKKKEVSERDMAARIEAVSMRESGVRAKEEGLPEAERKLRERELRLQDEQAVLVRAWEEFKKIRGW